MNGNNKDNNVPINSFDVISYYDILWGQLEDLYFLKWGARLRFDDWLFSVQCNFIGSQIIEFMSIQVEKVLKAFQTTNHKQFLLFYLLQQ